jgi:hypothetical protein
VRVPSRNRIERREIGDLVIAACLLTARRERKWCNRASWELIALRSLSVGGHRAPSTQRVYPSSNCFSHSCITIVTTSLPTRLVNAPPPKGIGPRRVAEYAC